MNREYGWVAKGNSAILRVKNMGEIRISHIGGQRWVSLGPGELYLRHTGDNLDQIQEHVEKLIEQRLLVSLRGLRRARKFRRKGNKAYRVTANVIEGGQGSGVLAYAPTAQKAKAALWRTSGDYLGDWVNYTDLRAVREPGFDEYAQPGPPYVVEQNKKLPAGSREFYSVGPSDG